VKNFSTARRRQTGCVCVRDCRRRGLLGDRHANTTTTFYQRPISSSTRTHEHTYNKYTDLYFL